MKTKRILKHKHVTSLFILRQIPGFANAHEPLKGDFQKTNFVSALIKKTLKWASFSALSFSPHFHLSLPFIILKPELWKCDHGVLKPRWFQHARKHAEQRIHT